MRAENGPGVEFLEYVTPGDGRLFPRDAKGDDLFYWQTTVVGEELAGITEKVRERGVGDVAGKIVKGVSMATGFEQGVRLRDPDGHFLMVVGK